jgi:TPR repeat protein/pimeloyl-ACP methyl ester carboxylesterase
MKTFRLLAASLVVVFGTIVPPAMAGNPDILIAASTPSAADDENQTEPPVLFQAEAGDATREFELGAKLLKNQSQRDEAVRHLKNAAELGHIEADVLLGNLYASGYTKAVPVDWSHAYASWLKQAEHGDRVAQRKIGLTCYRNGRGVKQDSQMAIYWLEKAAAQGDIFAMEGLGRMYSGDRDVPPDDAKYFYWMEKALRNGVKFASLHVAVCYFEGRGTERNADKAFEIALPAAKRGVGEAMLMVARMYADGIGVAKDPIAAREWAEKADTKKVKGAFELLSRLDGPSLTISVTGSEIPVVCRGSGPLGVIFFGHSGSQEMVETLLREEKWFGDLLPDQCSFFLWSYPDGPPFDKVSETISAYRGGDHSVRLPLPDIAESVVSQIQKATGIDRFLIVGNSLGAGIVLWDYEKLVKDPALSFLLISPTEAFLPEPSQIPPIQRTMILAAKGWMNDGGLMRTDPFLRGEEAWDWVAQYRDDETGDLISDSLANGNSGGRSREFDMGHKIIGGDINAELLGKLIRVNLGLSPKEILAEPPLQTN